MNLRAVLALTGLLASTSLIACGPPPNKNAAKKVGTEAEGGEGEGKDNAPTALANTKFVESPAGGDPLVVGCADGQREGFADMTKFPTIAGCLGVWEGAITLRKGKTSKACGDDSEMCASPADVCAEGWHVCARDGNYADLSDRVNDKDCAKGAGPGKFLAAISHVKKKKDCPAVPDATTRYPCLKNGWGAEPVCCGDSCEYGSCRDSVWAKKTRISKGTNQGCGDVTSDRNGGVLCCKDGEGAGAGARAIPAMPTDSTTTTPPAEGLDPTGTPIGEKPADKPVEPPAENKPADDKPK